MKFKSGDKVRWLCPDGYYCYGEITIPGENRSKVMFDGNYDWNYDYYRNEELELITEEDLKDDIQREI